MAAITPSKGWVAKYAATATPTTTIDNLRSVRLGGGSREMLNTTTHSSSTTKSYKPAPLRDTNEVALRFLYDPADTLHELVRAHWSAGTKGYLTLVAPDSGNANFVHEGNITDWQIVDQDPETGLMEVEIVFKADGADSFAA